MGRKSRVAVAVGVVLVLAVGALLYARSRDETTPVSVGDAVSGFRSGQSEERELARPTPEPGVYVYSTMGYELVGGTFSSRHDYPGTSTVTITDVPCGKRERWDALAERQSTSDTCVTADSTRLRSVVEYHEFFNQAREARFDCSERLVPRTDRLEVGERWSIRCSTPEGDTMRVAGKVVERGETEVAGEAVPSVHLRVVSTLRGGFRGRNAFDAWLRRSDGLLLRRRQQADMKVDTPIGEAPYRERYEIRLRSLDPRR